MLQRWSTARAPAGPGEGPHPPKSRDAPYLGEGRFFLTGRMTGDVVGRTAGDAPLPVSVPALAPASASSNGMVGPAGHPPAVPGHPPAVTAERVGAQMVVAAACPAARAAGIEPGSPLTRARLVAPDLRVFPADRAGDRAELLAMATSAARRWSPAVALSGDDGLFVDLTGCAHLHGGEERWARGAVRMLARLGVQARVAVADTAGAAHALARFGGQRVTLCPPAAHPEMIASLPAAALRLEPAHVELLHRLGVDTVAQLAALPRKGVGRRFGGALVRRLDQALGAMPEPMRPVDVPEPVRAVRRFAEPVMTAEGIEAWLRDLTPRFCEGLARAGLGVRVAVFAAERVDGTTQAIRVGLSRASRDPAHLLRLLTRRIEQVSPGWGLDSLSLHAVRTEPLGAEAMAPRLAGDAVPDLAPLVDVVADRTGGRVWRDRPVESDVPERSVARAGPLDTRGRGAAALRADDVRRLDARPPDHPWNPRWPRPARLLRRPEAVEHVLSEIPDGAPARFTWRGERYEVQGSDGPERISGEWWRRLVERQAVRDYWRVEVTDGRRFWLYRRGDGVRAETGDLRWFLHGLFG
jgi:protein ImuB